jgi:hypothetical protein
MLIALLVGCMATIRVETDLPTADIYITRNYAPSSKEAPSSYIAHSKGDLQVTTGYWSWDQFYVWAGGQHSQAKVVAVPNNVKVGPVIGAILCLWPVLWAWGPDDTQVLSIKVKDVPAS